MYFENRKISKAIKKARFRRKNNALWCKNSAYFKNPSKNRLKSEAVAPRRSVKTMLLKKSQNSQKNTCARVSFK